MKKQPAELHGFRYGEVEQRELPYPGKRCRGCRLWFAAAGFRPSARLSDGLETYCLSCERERRQRWRDAHPEYVEAYNASRREGPFPATCLDCGQAYEASRRIQVRCPDCQAAMRKARR